MNLVSVMSTTNEFLSDSTFRSDVGTSETETSQSHGQQQSALSASTSASLFLFSLSLAETSSFVSQPPPPESLCKSFVKHSCASTISKVSASADTDPPPPHPPTHLLFLLLPPSKRSGTSLTKISPFFTHLW